MARGPLVPGASVAPPGRPGQLLRLARRRLRRRESEQPVRPRRARPRHVGAAALAGAPQQDAPRRPDLDHPEPGQPTTRPPGWSPSRARATSATTGSRRARQVCPTLARAGRTSHALVGTVEFTKESQFAPTLTGLGTRAAGGHRRSRPVRSCHWRRGRPHRRVHRRRRLDGCGLGLRHRRRRRGCRSPAECASSATARASCPRRGRRRDHGRRRRRHAAQRQDRRALQAHRPGNAYVSSGRRRRRRARRTSRCRRSPTTRTTRTSTRRSRATSRWAASGTSTAAGCRSPAPRSARRTRT